MSELWNHCRTVWRQVRRRPSHYLLVLGTLALGIGANTAIFSVARGVLLRPLPYQDPDSLVMIWRAPKARPSVWRDFEDERRLARQPATRGMVQQWRTEGSLLDDLAAIEIWQSGNTSAQVDIVIGNEATRLRGALTSPNLFELLGVRAAIGRTFAEDDQDVVMLSDGLWQRWFGADPAVLGKTVQLAFGRTRERKTVTIVGILPREFRLTYPEDTEIWLSVPWADLYAAPQDALRYHVIGRLRAGVGLAAAQAELDALYSAYEDAMGLPSTLRMMVALEPLHDYSVGRVANSFGMLAGVTGIVLAICCSSVATLFVGSALGRRREIAVQLALGATRARLGRQILVESTLMAVAAGGCAILVVFWSTPAIANLLPPTVPRSDEVGVDLFTVAWTTAIVILAIGLTSFAPLVVCTAADPAVVLAAHSMATPRPATVRLRQMLIAFQVCMVALLMIVGGRLLHGFWQLTRTDLGFERHGVVTAQMHLLGSSYRTDQQLTAFQEQLLTRVRALPDVANASVTSSVPFRGTDWLRMIRRPGQPDSIATNLRQVDGEYFAIMGIPVVEGRLFLESDGPAAPLVGVLSQSLALALFPNGNAVGQILDINGPMTIVGVVKDVRTKRVDTVATPAIYLHWPQQPTSLVCLVIKPRNAGDTRDLAAAVAAVVRSIDPHQPVQAFAALEELVSNTIVDRRFFGVVTTALAILTMMLAVAGIFGVLVVAITERTREFGIRASVGATPRAQVLLAMRHGLLPIAVGTLLGTIGGMWAIRLIEQLVFRIGSADLRVYVVAAVSVLAVGSVACFIPARRVTKVSVSVALRAE